MVEVIVSLLGHLCSLKIFYGQYHLFIFFLFQRFQAFPNIFVTVRHQVLKRPQDALALWVDDLRKDSFKLCAREIKSFDGIHKNIKVVSNNPDNCFLRKLIVLLVVESWN